MLSSHVSGEWRRGSTDVPRTSPADAATALAQATHADAALAARGVEAARAAARAWRSAGPADRASVLHRAADLLDARTDEISRDLSAEEGKTLAESVREIQLAARILRYQAAQTLEPDGETYPSQQGNTMLFTRREPLGVVSIITPWNFPISIPAWKIAPGLAFGNTVVWKPAEIVPHTAVHFMQALIDAGLPAGVLNLVIGRGSVVGDVLTTHPAVDAVSFTGSTAVGHGIRARAAAEGKKVQLELGGKNPAVVLADASLDVAAEQISLAAFGGTGQKCTATSRVIVERPVLAEFVDLLTQRAESWRLGDPLDPRTTLGPLASGEQLTSVLGFVERARRDGGKVAAGGDRADGVLAKGYFVPPTIVVDVEPNHAVAREEIFGPVVAVLPADSYEHAVAMANDTPYGLSASLFTQDLSRALRFVDESESGIVKVNQATSGVEHHVPFGGTKGSGYGEREQGKAARAFFTKSKTAYVGFG